MIGAMIGVATWRVAETLHHYTVKYSKIWQQSNAVQGISPSTTFFRPKQHSHTLDGPIHRDSVNPSSISNTHPTLFKVAQWNIKQSRDHHCNFEANITSLARDRSRIPHLAHRRYHKRKAQNRCPESSRAQRKLRWYVPVSDVVERKFASAEIKVFNTDRRYPCTWRGASSQLR